ncbi:hypothetical protein T439DRAFT_329587, partial [Meredithblackwellia eburnea MCA 4105]
MAVPLPEAVNSAKLDNYKQEALKNMTKNLDYLHQRRDEYMENYAKPAADFVSNSAQSRPFTTTFLANFLALSILPVLGFLLFTAGTFITIFGGAVVFGLFWTTVLVGGAGLLLLGTLFVTTLISLFVVFWFGVAFAAAHLLKNISQASSIAEGLKVSEEKARLFVSDTVSSLKRPQLPNGISTKVEEDAES